MMFVKEKLYVQSLAAQAVWVCATYDEQCSAFQVWQNHVKKARIMTTNEETSERHESNKKCS